MDATVNKKSGRFFTILMLTGLFVPHLAGTASAAKYQFHKNPDELVVTLGDKVIQRLPCERIPLEGKGRWDKKAGGHYNTRGQIGRTSDGTIYAQVVGVYG